MCLLILTSTFISYQLGYISNIKIIKTKDGWVCEGPVHFSKYLTYNSIFLRDNKLLFVEKYNRYFYFNGFAIEETKKSFLRDVYYVRALNLSNGCNVYRTKMKFGKHPIQVFDIFPWFDNTVVIGYYQDKTGRDNIKNVITILNSRGKVKKQILLNYGVLALDEKNNLLICGGLNFIELPSGMEKFKAEVNLLIDADTDKNGNIYIIRSLKADGVENEEGIYDAIVEKYSTTPWKLIWSVTVEGEEKSRPYRVYYKDNMLYVYYYEVKSRQKEENLYPFKALDPNNGAVVETKHLREVFSIEEKLDGRKYIAAPKENEISVRIISSVSTK